MEQKNKTAFISYSWDSTPHQEWVVRLANKLRVEGGIEANVDVFETTTRTVNLNTMMIKNMRDNDFAILVLTENFAKKANELEGGVGFETMLSLPILRKNPDKLIFILRHQGDFEKVFPFHLEGYYAIDFSNDNKFEEKYNELLHRIEGVPLYRMEPVGKPRVLQPKDLNKTMSIDVDFSDLNLTSSKNITDRDIDKFMKDSFKQITQIFNLLFSQVKNANPGFDFDQEEIEKFKTIFSLYVNGQNVNNIKIWYGGSFGWNTINLSYGRHLMSDNSMNEMITYDVTDKNELKLKMTMNIFGDKAASTPEEIVKEIWKNNISHSIM
ncbi:toll/interleukin-1 receptor domain-containing protein [Neobacillus sp. GCM10023253]|uniref:toll/interleukin-1 receptor domain-containing protein n=1 Tax=Neobacillus sp. GCM10023253 TaxID=3252644 RepID=UPI003613DFA8